MGWPDCIEWNGTRDKHGYGKTRDGQYAHRWVLKELGIDIEGKVFAKGRNRNGKELVTHCPRGHEYTEENTRMNGTHRVCRTCHRDDQRLRNQRNRGQ